jgi:hypothetical protein
MHCSFLPVFSRFHENFTKLPNFFYHHLVAAELESTRPHGSSVERLGQNAFHPNRTSEAIHGVEGEVRVTRAATVWNVGTTTKKKAACSDFYF